MEVELIPELEEELLLEPEEEPPEEELVLEEIIQLGILQLNVTRLRQQGFPIIQAKTSLILQSGISPDEQ